VPEITYLPQVECVVDIPRSFFDTAVVGVPDVTGNRHYLRVPRNNIVHARHKAYLPIAVIELDYADKKALVELPQEADSGRRRLWVPFDSFRPSEN
jgi:hypothetical protein